jgi:hypothetical protein
MHHTRSALTTLWLGTNVVDQDVEDVEILHTYETNVILTCIRRAVAIERLLRLP